MIRLIKFWSVHYVDDNRMSKNVKFQTWINENTGEKEYYIFKPPKMEKEKVTKEKGNKYFHYLNKRYLVRVNKII